jgi:hypothetical protein
MPEENVGLELAKAATSAVAGKAYDDVAHPTMAATGTVLSLLPRTVRLWLSKWEKYVLMGEANLEQFAVVLKPKADAIPEGKLTEPEPYVAIPAIQQLSYSFNSEVLREMYANLLAASMNIDTKWDVHPSFVEIIKQLTPNEAVFLNYLKGYRKALIDYEFQFKEFGGFFGQNLIAVSDRFDQEDITLYINNYIRLGISEKALSNRDSCATEFEEVEEIAIKECKISLEEDYEHKFTHEELAQALKCNYYWLQLTSFGDSFVETCVYNFAQSEY